MLTHEHGRREGRSVARCRAVAAAVVPTARVAHLAPTGATVAFAMLPGLVTVAAGGTDLTNAVLLASLAAGAALGWATEDPAAALLAPMPVSAPIRAVLRTLAALTVVLLGVVVGLVLLAAGPGLPADARDRLPESLAAASIALALGLVLARRGARGGGAASVMAGLVSVGVVAALAFRWPRVLPSFAAGPVHDRWWVAVALASAAAVHSGRDPGRS